MRTSIRTFATGVAVAALAAGLLATSTAQAVTSLPSPDTVFQAWNSSFLATKNGETFYADSLTSKGTSPEYMWIQALDDQVAQDAYERTHSPAYRTLVNNLVSTYIKLNGKTWTSWDTWNDDIGWGLITTLRGYATSGDQSLVDVASDQWNKTWARGWTSDAGGGIWEDQNTKDKRGKCALSNDPIALTGVWLSQITGDRTYLDRAEQIYSWVKKTLVDPSSGQVHGCVVWPNGLGGASSVQKSANAYDQGSFLAMADALYRATGNQTYLDDATKTADREMSTSPIIANNGTLQTSLQYWYFKGLSDYCTDAGTCAKYDAYMRSNAAQAWSERNSLNLTWNDWKNPTDFASPDSFMMNSMPGLFQSLPDLAASPFSGSYTLQNVASKQYVSVTGDSTAVDASIVQSAAGTSAAWTLTPASNGYYWIKDVHSGQVLNVTAASGKVGAAIAQHPAGSLVPGGDLWKPVKNADGSYSFYNRNSKLALTSATTAAAGQLSQAAADDSAAQKFTLSGTSGGTPPTPGPVTPTSTPSATPAPPVSTGNLIKTSTTGRCVDVPGGTHTAATDVWLWDCNGGSNQTWVASGAALKVYGNMCLDAFGAKTADGTPIIIWPCHGHTNQQWTVNTNGMIVGAGSGKCLDTVSQGTTSGTKLVLETCDGAASQRWTRS